jgi:hypothetical protein
MFPLIDSHMDCLGPTKTLIRGHYWCSSLLLGALPLLVVQTAGAIGTLPPEPDPCLEWRESGSGRSPEPNQDILGGKK